MNIQDILYPYNGILFCHEEWSIDSYNKDEHWKHTKEPDTKDYVVSDSIYMKCLEEANSYTQKVINCCRVRESCIRCNY